jgi:LAO/AO transport system kinase
MDEKKLNDWLKSRKERKAHMSADHLVPEILKGDIQALSSAITLLESTLSADKAESDKIIEQILPNTGNAIRVGITGVPGVGKSSFIEQFGLMLLDRGHKVAVLAIDPSSGESGGSILGDKTRMNELSRSKNVFIRPTPAGTTLGGVARATRECIYLCEAAGFDVVIIETVGVGQSETLVHSMVDFFLLLMLSGAGDELQGIKRGIMEMADALVITKADGENVKKAELAARQYANAMHLFPPKKSNWIPLSFTSSSQEKMNIDKVWDTITSFQNQTKSNGWFEEHRHIQDKYWLRETLKELILDEFFDDPELIDQLKTEETQVYKGKVSSFKAAEQLFEAFNRKIRGKG